MNEVFDGFIKQILPQAAPEMVAVAMTADGKTLGMHMTAAEAAQFGKAPVTVTLPSRRPDAPARKTGTEAPSNYQPARIAPKESVWEKIADSDAGITMRSWLKAVGRVLVNEIKPTPKPSAPTVESTPLTALPTPLKAAVPSVQKPKKTTPEKKQAAQQASYDDEVQQLMALANETRHLRAAGQASETDDTLLDELMMSAHLGKWNDEQINAAFDYISGELYPGDPFIVQLKRAEMADALAAHYITRADNEEMPSIIPEEPVITPVVEDHGDPTSSEIDDTPEYGTMPKAAGEMALAAWLAGRYNFLESAGLSPLEFQKEKARLFAELLTTTTGWGWNAAAINEAAKDFDARFAALEPAPIQKPVPEPAPELAPHQYLITHPDGTTTPITIVPSQQKPFIRKAPTAGQSAVTSKDKKPTQRHWRRIVGGVAVAAVGIAGVLLGVKACSNDGATPEPKPTATSTSSAGNTNEEKPGDTGKDNQGTKDSKYSKATKAMENVRKHKDGRIFVDATPWTPQRSTIYPTYWNLAGETIRANEDRKPTMREYVFVKNALLRANHETETSARRMPIGHDMFLLTKAQYDAAMAKAHNK